jgi:hypothetical protein
MGALLITFLAVFLGGCATMQPSRPTVSILVDLDPARADRSVIVESITADKEGRLYLPDRVTGNILRVDPKLPKLIVVGRIEAEIRAGRSTLILRDRVNHKAISFAVGPFSEVCFRGGELNPGDRPFATGTAGANGIVFDRQGNLYVSGGGSGVVYRIGSNGGAAQPAFQIEKFSRTLPDGKAQQAIVANGVELDAKGGLYVADTARGAIWKVTIGADGKGGKPALLAQSPLLEARTAAFDRRQALGDVERAQRRADRHRRWKHGRGHKNAARVAGISFGNRFVGNAQPMSQLRYPARQYGRQRQRPLWTASALHRAD